MSRKESVFTLLLLSLFGPTYSCLKDPAAAYRHSGAVCRLTYPAAAVLNEKTTKVIEAAFQHARYPSMQGEKSLPLIGKVSYGLENLEIHNLSIGQSEFELVPGKGIALKISNVSAVFKGTILYGYGSWLINVEQSLDLEIESQIDLGINPRLYCGKGKVAADTSDCYLKFHKLRLHLQGDKEPNWLKKLFTDFITFTVKLVVKGQICKEINKLADILSDFVQDTAAHFLSDGDISVDIGVSTAPTITANYIESYHKGLTNYNNTTSVLNESVFHPSQLTEDRMLFFWFSDELFNPLIAAAHHDGRFHLNVSSEELSELLKSNLSSVNMEHIQTCLAAASAELRVWSSAVPHLHTFNTGSRVSAQARGELHCGGQGTPALVFETRVLVDVTASYADKKLFLHGSPKEISVLQAEIHSPDKVLQDEAQAHFIREAVEKVGVPKVLSVLQVEITRLLNKQGANLFDIVDPEVLPQDGFIVTKMDFGFPHHLLVDFLQKTLQ
ncbi:Cholesteryl ester transfer protein [Oryzias melastigma]|uniref:Cholesteryl ester transfer protein n=1 Tax=Oryzias melastigma TaxID=30732 RepID=A0A3B3CAJ7_ORYME|nr:cholesteryl ester transfer protein [Oryzias melastigma]XP_024119956.1 cholesteryl ester transfer protein [Oryzias melastigma]KAF6737023.1 Cholesteryl ester transfer protein [Oryzias melastigma]